MAGRRPAVPGARHAARSSAGRAQVLVRAGQPSGVPVPAVPLALAVGHLGATCSGGCLGFACTSIASHPDLAGGLGFLSLPSEGFAYVVAGLSATQAGVYANQFVTRAPPLASFEANVLVFTVVAVILALGPLIVFAGHLSSLPHRRRHPIRPSGDGLHAAIPGALDRRRSSGATCSATPTFSRWPTSQARARSSTAPDWCPSRP